MTPDALRGRVMAIWVPDRGLPHHGPGRAPRPRRRRRRVRPRLSRLRPVVVDQAPLERPGAVRFRGRGRVVLERTSVERFAAREPSPRCAAAGGASTPLPRGERGLRFMDVPKGCASSLLSPRRPRAPRTRARLRSSRAATAS
jgi:hypothetical protein